jgi:hypothetical protein
MKWKVKAIENENGQDIYIGDEVLINGEIIEVKDIQIINSTLLINGEPVFIEELKAISIDNDDLKE